MRGETKRQINDMIFKAGGGGAAGAAFIPPTLFPRHAQADKGRRRCHWRTPAALVSFGVRECRSVALELSKPEKPAREGSSSFVSIRGSAMWPTGLHVSR